MSNNSSFSSFGSGFGSIGSGQSYNSGQGSSGQSQSGQSQSSQSQSGQSYDSRLSEPLGDPYADWSNLGRSNARATTAAMNKLSRGGRYKRRRTNRRRTRNRSRSRRRGRSRR